MNARPFTTSPGYRVAPYGTAGQTAILSPRGCVALMNAGSQPVRDTDAAQIVATCEAFPRLLAVARAVADCPDYRGISTLEMRALRAELAATLNPKG